MKTVGFLLLMVLGGAMMARIEAAPPRVAPPAYRFDIPAGALDDAIARFRAVTGRAVVTPPRASLEGLVTQGVSGVLTADEALRRLLDGTGLTFHQIDALTFALDVAVPGENVEVTGRTPYRTEVTTTATRTLAPLLDVPQAITVVTQQLIADQQMRSMADVVRYVPGVGMGQGEGNRDAPIFRGNSTTADFFVDGVRDDVQYFRDLYNVERVEALKGPNAMMFGRGGAGGVINRTTRQADWGTSREISLVAGSHGSRRAMLDLDQRVNGAFAARLTGVYENAESYRRGVTLERTGINPTFAWLLGSQTIVRAGYEHFADRRTAARGVPSFAGRPLMTEAATFFGDPQTSVSRATVDALSASVDHRFGGGMLRNRTRFAAYDKFYQNVYPSNAVNAAGTEVAISAYNNATQRQNLFNQTDISFALRSGTVRHTVLTGAELGRQVTGNFRETGYFTAIGPAVTSINVAVTDPTISTPVTYRQSATDADNRTTATVAAVYVQDEIAFSTHVQAVAGLRYDRFVVDTENHRTGATFSSHDDLVSPRVGLVVKPTPRFSVYSSYGVAYMPRSGDQLSSLSLSNQTLEPERFINYESGVKWDLRSDLSLTAAVYRLDRTNVVIPDPNDATRSLLVDGQRTQGVELGVAGNPTQAWTVMGGYAVQHGRITRTLSAAAREGAALGHVPAHTFSLWNRYDATHRLGAGLGIIHSSDMFTSTDNTVTLPAFTRVDGALYLTLTAKLRAQVNVENVLGARYFAFANGNNNITPGAPRSLRVALTTRF